MPSVFCTTSMGKSSKVFKGNIMFNTILLLFHVCISWDVLRIDKFFVKVLRCNTDLELKINPKDFAVLMVSEFLKAS